MFRTGLPVSHSSSFIIWPVALSTLLSVNAYLIHLRRQKKYKQTVNWNIWRTIKLQDGYFQHGNQNKTMSLNGFIFIQDTLKSFFIKHSSVDGLWNDKSFELVI